MSTKICIRPLRYTFNVLHVRFLIQLFIHLDLLLDGVLLKLLDLLTSLLEVLKGSFMQVPVTALKSLLTRFGGVGLYMTQWEKFQRPKISRGTGT